MLQRAASNAYSWWWASHIRTKQSKWLEQNLQDMEEKVTTVLKLIEEDGDSFAKRAEMYYKKRPELIHFVEESYRAYRALAERYDHISTELQNANNTIASVFPEQVQFMDDDDEISSPRFPKKPSGGGNSKANVPKVPKLPGKDMKGLIASATKKMQEKKPTKGSKTNRVPKSGLTKEEGLEEIDRLQKRILALQTEKEFVKSSYESGLAKYWEIDIHIQEMQDKICRLQDEFGEGRVIDDDEARNLMAETALNSCKETLTQLQEKQERSIMEAEVEQKRIQVAKEKLQSLKKKFDVNEVSEEKKALDGKESGTAVEPEVCDASQKKKDMEALREKIKEHFKAGFGESLTVTEMAEKIDELVNKVINLETAVSSQTALIERLRSETDELQAQIQSLEDDKAALIDGKNDLKNKLKEMEEKLHGIQDLNKSVEDQSNNLETHFIEAHCNLDHLSEKVQNVKPDEEFEREKSSSMEEENSSMEKEIEDSEKMPEKAQTGKEFEVADEAECENSPAEVKSQEKYEEKESRNLHEISDNKNLESAKPEMAAVSSAKPEKDSLVKGDVKSQEKYEEKDSRNLDASGDSKNLQSAKPEMAGVSSLLPEEKDSMVKVESPKESKEEGKKLDDNGDSIKGRDEKLEAREDMKKNDSVTEEGGHSHESLTNSEKCEDLKDEDKVKQQSSSQIEKTIDKVQLKEQENGEEIEPDWKQLLSKDMADREKNLLMEYTKMLRNYKNTKKKLKEVESNKETGLYEIMLQLKELKNSNTTKDEEIRSLRQKLSHFQTGFGVDNSNDEHKASSETEVDHSEQTTSAIEEKFRMHIDELLEENLDFWLRFSTAFQEVQKFETSVRDLEAELTKLEERHKADGSSTAKYSLKSDVRPLYKHLREVQNELNVWVEKSMLLKEELKNRFASLCDIQEEITKALKASAEDDDFKFTSYQAAKFQGEILNMKQENNKVADELQAGLDHITTLQIDVERTLVRLTEDWGLSGSKNRLSGLLQHSDSRSGGVPLRSFIFGVKPKKQRTSIFSCVHPALQRKYNGLRSGSSSNR